MKRLKLFKPWQLPTVRMTLADCSYVAPERQAPAATTAPCNAPARDEVRGGDSFFRVAFQTAPACSVIFASAANQHVGCPRQSI